MMLQFGICHLISIVSIDNSQWLQTHNHIFETTFKRLFYSLFLSICVLLKCPEDFQEG